MIVRPAGGLSPDRQILGNGAVVIVQDTATTPAVTINAQFLAGSVHEPGRLLGLSYLTSRLLDRGTETRSRAQIAEQLDDRGVALRVVTARHTTTISCTCLAEDFDDLVSIVLDIARRPVFDEAEIVKRRAEWVTALHQDDDNPGARAGEGLFELLYGAGHPYGRRSKGTLETVDCVQRPDLVSFHAARFVPSSLSLAIVGDVRAGHALERSAREMEGWTGAPVGPELVASTPPAAGRRLTSIAMPGKAQSDIAYGFTAIRRLDPRFYAYWLMNNVLGQFGLGGRLADNIRERQGMAYYTFSAFDASLGEGPLMVRAGVDPRNVTRALEAIDYEVHTLGAGGPTAGELAESKQYLIGSIPRLLETNRGIASFLLSADQFGLGLDFDRRLPGLLQAVTLDEAAAAAAEVLRPERAAVVIAGPPAEVD